MKRIAKRVLLDLGHYRTRYYLGMLDGRVRLGQKRGALLLNDSFAQTIICQLNAIGVGFELFEAGERPKIIRLLPPPRRCKPRRSPSTERARA